MMKVKLNLMLVLVLAAINLNAQNVEKTRLNLNKISTAFENNGKSDAPGEFKYPKESGEVAVFQTGLVFGAKVSGQIRVGGSVYRTGLVPGWYVNFYSAFFLNETTGWVAGSDGIILKTENGGINWVRQKSGTNSELRSVYFVDSNIGWAVGANGTILKTTDAGSIWQSQTSPSNENLFSVHFVNQNNGWAVGANGTILFTTNGIDWNIQQSPESKDLNSVFFTSQNSGWAAGEDGLLLNTTNGGTLWASQSSQTTMDLYSIYFVDSNNGWISGEGGTILKTTNASSWASLTVGSSNLYSISFRDLNNGIVVGSFGKILKTDNNGTSWQDIVSPVGNSLYSANFIDANNAFIAGNLAAILKTSNGGVEWENKIPTRIFRVRPDVFPGGPAVDLSVEANDEGKTEQDIRTQYEADWSEWPSYMGAPFKDNNSDGIYQPDTDIPGVNGAAQTIWFISNDSDASSTSLLYGSPPLNIEYQATIWAYKNSTGFDNFFFRKYKLINKTHLTGDPESFDDMYVSLFSDTDIGTPNDDFAGCDTLLNLGYGYNAADTDNDYSPLTPPVVGFRLIKGPSVSGTVNLPMTAFYYFSPMLSDPQQGIYDGTLQFYNYLQGKTSFGGQIINPVNNQPTKFMLSGNPVTSEGWVDGISEGMGDRRFGLSTGPFQMAAADTQVVVYAQIAAGAETGVDRLAAIDVMKNYSNIAQDFYNTNFSNPVSVKEPVNLVYGFNLYQNYPNPFNPTTRISWQSAVGSWQTLKVYDILGNEVATLVDEYKPAGNYEVTYDASKLSSGVYFYQLKAGNFSETKKLVLLR